MVYIIHGETLLDFITGQNPRNLQKVQVLADIGAAMAFLHSSRPQIVHGDLKDSNIFVEETCHARRRAKLLDFGLSVLRATHSRSRGGTVHWMAPEMALTNLVPSTKLDVFSFGRVIFFTVTGTLPHRNMIESAHLYFCKFL